MRMRDLQSGRPIVTQVLIALNVLGMLAAAATGGSLFDGGGTATENGLLIGYWETTEMTRFGFVTTPIGVASGEWYRVFTGGFLHSGLLHLGMNMLLLYLLGTQLEPLLGKARFLALYVACLAAGSFGVLLVSPTAATVGASGAVFGLMGAAVIAQRRAGIDIWRNGIGGLVLINLLITFAVPGISVGAHIGGLVAGVLIGALVFALDSAVRAPLLGTAVCAVLTVALVFGCIWAAGQWADPVLNF
jgi:membrane associated rhomboid family serine protease